MKGALVEIALARWLNEFADRGFFTTNERLIVTSWNRWLERHSGRSAATVVGRPLFEVYPELRERRLDEHYYEALAGHAYLVSQSLHGYLLLMAARSTDEPLTVMPQRARIAPLRIDDQIVGTVTLIDDVTERVASERELRRQIEAQELARTAAENALRLQDEFLATLSHEIRTPLNAVLGWARMLTEREVESELLARGLQAIFRNSMVQARMIDDLLDTARIMAGKLRLQMQPVDLLDVMVAALDVLSPMIEAKRIEVRKTFGRVQRVLGDPDRLQQIIWNLLSNSAKFTDPGGTIEIRIQQVENSVNITVADNGQGITAEFLPFVFERFRQAAASSSRREGGLGLGLALVRELVELHGGSVRAVSPGLGKGSTFVVELPTIPAGEERQADAEDAEDALARAKRPLLAGVHVLVVEDEEDARELMAIVLSADGARVTAVGSCAEAMERLANATEESRPDVIVSDIAMAREDGYELIRRVRELPPERGGTLPAIAVTAYTAPEDRVRALTAGYQMHIAKPADPVALVAAVSKVARHVDV